MPNYLKQILHTQLFSILNIIFGFGTLLILMKYLEVTQYGEYILIQGFIAFGGQVFSQNLFSYSRLHIPGAEINIQYGYLKTVIIIVFAIYLEVIFIAKLLNFEDVIFDFFELESHLGNLILIMLAFELLNMEIMRYFIAIKKIYLKNYAQFFQKAFVFFGSLVLIYNGRIDFSIVTFLYLYISGQLLVLIILIYDIDTVNFFKSYFMQDVLQQGYTVALPLLPIGLMSIALNYTDTLMISKFMDKGHVAQYGFASQIVAIVMMMIGTSITLTLFPYATEAHNNKDVKLRTGFFMKMLKFGGGLALLFYLLSIVNSHWIISLFRLDNYSDVPLYLSVLAIFPFFQLLYSASSHHLQLLKVFKVQVFFAIIVIIENGFLNYFMIQSYGIMGSAFASLIAFITLSVLYLSLVIKHDRNILKMIKKSISLSTLLILFSVTSIGVCFPYFSIYKNTDIVLSFDLLSVIGATIFLFKFKRDSAR